MAARGPQNGRRGLERGLTLGYWPFRATLAKFLDPSIPSMRKGDDGGEKRENEKKKSMMKIVATNVVASRPPNGDRLQRRPLVPKTIRYMCGCLMVYYNQLQPQ